MIVFRGFLNRPTYRDIRKVKRRTVLQLGSPLWYMLNGRSKMVEDNYTCDGNSYPWLTWLLLGHPLDGLALLAGVLHDWLYFLPVNHPDKLSRADADEVYRQALIWLGMHPARARVRWVGVRIGGWLHFNNTAERR